jgi:hypothetical protein
MQLAPMGSMQLVQFQPTLNEGAKELRPGLIIIVVSADSQQIEGLLCSIIASAAIEDLRFEQT